MAELNELCRAIVELLRQPTLSTADNGLRLLVGVSASGRHIAPAIKVH
jgi:hypothetical protein